MDATFFLIFVIILFCIIVYMIFRINADKDQSSSSFTTTDKPSKKISGDVTVTTFSEVDDQKTALLKLYPVLNNISYVPLQKGLKLSTLKDTDKRVIKAAQDLIVTFNPLSINTLKLMELLRDPDSNPGEINSIVMTNPIFSAVILRAVNSAYFNLAHKITAVGRAITLLGYNNVRTLIFHDALNNVIPNNQSYNAEVYKKIWIHSAVVSACAGYLGRTVFNAREHELATIGLLHDIGRFFIQTLGHEDVEEEDLPYVIREENSYGINHAGLGCLIAENWQLSKLIAKSIEYHHHPSFMPPESIPEPLQLYSFIICLSDLICKVLGYTMSNEEQLLAIRNEYYETFQLKPEILEIITPGLIREIEKAYRTVESYTNTAA